MQLDTLFFGALCIVAASLLVREGQRGAELQRTAATSETPEISPQNLNPFGLKKGRIGNSWTATVLRPEL